MVLGFVGDGGSGVSLVGLGMLGILIGVALMSPVIGVPIIRGLGVVYRRLFGTVGTLASENSLRNPRRTAATASALMIGLTLVALMSILGASMKASFDKVITAAVNSQLVVSNAIQTPFSPAIADQIRPIDGVDTVSQFRQAPGKVDGESSWIGAADPDQLSQVLNVSMTSGRSQFPTDGILVDANVADSNNLKVGDTATLRFQNDKAIKTSVAGLFVANSMPTQYIVSLDTMEKGGLEPADSLLFITTEPGANLDQVRASIDQVLVDLPTVSLKNPQEFVDEQLSFINRFLFIVYALLGLAIVIAVLGIINTLALSVIERTREVGLLRAVGLSRFQLRQMVRLESVAIALLGAVLGHRDGSGLRDRATEGDRRPGFGRARDPVARPAGLPGGIGRGRRVRRCPAGQACGQAQRAGRDHHGIAQRPPSPPTPAAICPPRAVCPPRRGLPSPRGLPCEQAGRLVHKANLPWSLGVCLADPRV